MSSWFPTVEVRDIEQPATSRILGPDGAPLQYQPQSRPVGFVPLKERPQPPRK